MKSKSKFLLALLLCGTMLAGCGEQGPKGDIGPQGEQGLPGNNGTNGTNGKDGVSIVSIVKTKTDGLVDTYTITFSDTTSKTFNVTNGADGVSAYELYCQEYDYKGSLTEWLEKFYSEDTTDYTKYDDFLFTEVTYGGVIGYAANYIGGNEKIFYPSTFKKLPVLLAGIGDVTYLPSHDLDDELPVLKEIHYPSSIKVISVSDIVAEKFDVSELKLYFETSIERYEAPYYAKEVYFEGDSLEAYLATNLRKYFTFSDVYVKDGEGYTRVINGQEKASDFLDKHYDIEGGIYDQIKEIMGGSTEFYKFGSFELTFPKKFTVNYENYDIDLPFNIVGFDLENHNGVTFEKGVLKGDASKYINNAYTLVGNVDLGIPGWRLHELTFNLFKEAKTIKIGDETLYKMDDLNLFSERDRFELNGGTYNVVVYDENNEVITRKIPLKASEGTEIDFVDDNSRTAINLKGTAEYSMLIDLDTFEMKIMPRSLETSIGDMILSSFKNENGFIGSPGIGLLRKELYLPKNRVIDVNGIKYSVDLTYNIEKDYCEDIDEEHKAIIYNWEKDDHAYGYNEYFVKISYSIPNDFLRGYFDYHVKMYGMNSAPTLGLNLHLGEEGTKAYELFLDYEQQTQLKTIFRLNEVNIDCEKFALTINGGEALYKLAAGSLGEIKDCYYQIESGVYNLTLDLDNNTLMIEESNGEYINKVKVGFFEHLKEEGFNVYVEDADNIVLFYTSESNIVSKTFDIEESDTLSIEAHVEIKKEGNYYSIASEDENSAYISLNYKFNGIQDNDSEKGFVVSIRADGYFIDAEDVLFHCTYRRCPANKEAFYIADADMYETVIDGNVFHLNNIYLDSDWYQIHLQSYNPDYPMTFHFEGGEGEPFSINGNLRLIVPSSRFGHHYNFVFDFNKLTVTVEQID